MAVKDLVSSHYVSVDVEDTVSHLLGKLRVLDEISALVFSGGKLVGMVDKRKFLKSRLDAKIMKVKRIVTKVPTLSPEDSEAEAARLLDTSDMHSLPVLDDGSVLGVVHARDILKTLKTSFQKYRLSDVTTTKLFTLDEDEWISKAINSFREKNFDHVPVLDKKRNLIGIVATTDLLEKYFAHPPGRMGGMGRRGAASNPAKEYDFSRLPIKNEMSLLVHTMSGSDPLSRAIDTMCAEHLSSVIVVEGNKPVGIVTVKDLLAAHGKLQVAPARKKIAKKK
ncbi:MAG: CBS domain-containing protein [Nanoarchaeota archaeon]